MPKRTPRLRIERIEKRDWCHLCGTRVEQSIAAACQNWPRREGGGPIYLRMCVPCLVAMLDHADKNAQDLRRG